MANPIHFPTICQSFTFLNTEKLEKVQTSANTIAGMMVCNFRQSCPEVSEILIQDVGGTAGCDAAAAHVEAGAV